MRRQLIVVAAAVLALAPAATALAQESGSLLIEEGEDYRAAYIGDLELGARIGLQVGGGVTPGGFRIAGAYMQRMTEETWFDGEAAFTFGGGGKSCYFNRDVELVCAPGLADGFSAQLAGGGRWYPTVTASGFVPFVRGGGALHIAHFGDDDLTGLALPLFAGAGGRYRVADRVAISGELTLFAGGAVYGRDVGLQPYAGLLVQFGVDFAP